MNQPSEVGALEALEELEEGRKMMKTTLPEIFPAYHHHNRWHNHRTTTTWSGAIQISAVYIVNSAII